MVIILLSCSNFGQEKSYHEATIKHTMSNDGEQGHTKADTAKERNNSSIGYEDFQELKEFLESNLLEDITFQESERAVFYYRSRKKEIFDGYVILVYKETAEHDIVFVGQLGIEKETGNMYLLKDNEYVLVKTGALKGFALPDIPQDYYWHKWEEGSDEEDYALTEEVYSEVFNCLKEEGIENIKIMDMGIYDFLGKKYYWLKLFADNDVQIFTLQHYCIDMENGNLYEVRDDMGETYMSLYFMGNVYMDND